VAFVVAPILPEIEPLTFLLGTWRGTGIGEYPTVPSFEYEEELEFGNVGKPYVTFRQRTWVVRDDERLPSHMEFGFWRPRPGGTLEVISAHPNGVAEVEVGTVDGCRVSLRSHRLITSPSAKDVVRLERDFTVDADALTYDVRMEAVGLPLRPHLRAELRRTCKR
jgi:THAP4-like, heme-binding beta-barrel domain